MPLRSSAARIAIGSQKVGLTRATRSKLDRQLLYGQEKFLFVTKTEPYDSDDAFPILVQRIETLVSKENVTWAQYLMKPDQEKAKVSG